MEDSPAQEQARLRRQRREKKILQGGSARLDKITSISGRAAPTSETVPPSQEPGSTAEDGTGPRDFADNFLPALAPSPEISDRKTQPELRHDGSEAARDAAGRQTGFENPIGSSAPLQNRPTEQVEDEQDPLRQLFQQMVGTSTMSDLPPGGGGFPPALESLFSQPTASPQERPTSQSRLSQSTYMWKILHPVLALSLGVFVMSSAATSEAFSKRTARQADGGEEPNLFWMFLTVELLLQATRYLLEPIPDRSGMLAKIASFLPHPWKGRLELAVRYKGIWSTLSNDALVVIWVLGMGAWWYGINYTDKMYSS